MDSELKVQLTNSVNTIRQTMEKWEHIKSIAEDIIAYVQHDARRFIVEIGASVGTKIVYGFITGADRYVSYGEELNETPLRQIYERFFDDERALVNMIRKLAEAVLEAAEERIEELKELSR